MNHPVFDLAVSRFDITLEAMERLHLPAFPGSKLEGAFGRALYKLSCTRTDLESCQPCGLRGICPYGCLYAPQLPEAMAVASMEHPPRPIVFGFGTGGERTLEAGERFTFSLAIAGNAVQHAPYIIAALREMGDDGIGRTRGRFQIETVDSTDPLTGQHETLAKYGNPVIQLEAIKYLNATDFPSLPSEITLEFTSFVHLTTGGSMAQLIHFPVLIRALQRRISNLEQLYGAGRSAGADYSALVQLARDIHTTTHEMQPAHQLRKGTGNSRVTMHGLIGQVSFTGDLEPFTALLRYGELLGVGKWAHFGAGQYTISPASNSSRGE
jgi:CRISPR-associated endoribonuclease Cas6